MEAEIHVVDEGNSVIPFLKEEDKNTIIFKESFDEGVIEKNIDSDSFWKKRYAHFEQKGISKLAYFDSTIKPLTILQDVPKNATVFLWFSNDEKNQINKIGLLAYLLNYYRKDVTYYSILTEEQKELEELLKGKKRLSRNKLLEAQDQWFSFVEKRNF